MESLAAKMILEKKKILVAPFRVPQVSTLAEPFEEPLLNGESGMLHEEHTFSNSFSSDSFIKEHLRHLQRVPPLMNQNGTKYIFIHAYSILRDLSKICCTMWYNIAYMNLK